MTASPKRECGLTNAFVTNSLCAPSRASILTGKYSHEHGTTENIFRDKEPFDASQMTFPKRLRNAGYTTLQIGKWHLESHPTGFDYWKRLPNQGRYKVPVFPEKPEGGGEPMRIQESGYITDIITELLDYLDETGLAKNTLLVFASDQGIFIGEHGYYDKRPMYEESIRLPLLMRYPPLIPAGMVEARIVRNIDFAAAFMGRAGVEIPDDVQGRNL